MNDVYISKPSMDCSLWVARNRNTGMVVAAEHTLEELVTTLGWLANAEPPPYPTVMWDDDSASIGHDGGSL